MVNTYISLKNSIKRSRHVRNTSMITNMSLNYANDARMAVIDFKKKQANRVTATW